jgi:hypothetical protein
MPSKESKRRIEASAVRSHCNRVVRMISAPLGVMTLAVPKRSKSHDCVRTSVFTGAPAFRVSIGHVAGASALAG